MSNQSAIKRALFAITAALVMSSVAVGAAVGPAQARIVNSGSITGTIHA